MTGLYYTEAAEWLRAIGLTVVECDGWQTRARSSGGFANPPLGIQWHHTASDTTPENDTAWQCEGSDDAPIGNATIMRDGAIWLVAAGAANTAGKGGPVTLSRGTVPIDSGNSTTWAWEVANAGTGQEWPAVQIDAYFAATLEMNRRFGNTPSDIFTHALGAGDGWTDRKIDPATADAVQGPWRPRSVTSSGTWSQVDIRHELERRAGAPIPPTPEPEPDPEPEPEPDTEEDSMLFLARRKSNPDLFLVGDGVTARQIEPEEMAALERAIADGVGPIFHDPSKAGRPVITDIDAVPIVTDTPLSVWLGHVIDTT